MAEFFALYHDRRADVTPAQLRHKRPTRAEAVALGERLLEQEAVLDQQFASRSVTPERLKAVTAAIGLALVNCVKHT
jgi:hypothetical protein